MEEGRGEVDTASRDSEGIDIQLRTTFVDVDPCLSYEGVGLVNEHNVSSDVNEGKWIGRTARSSMTAALVVTTVAAKAVRRVMSLKCMVVKM